MRANRVMAEYVVELLENVTLTKECAVCRSTLAELLAAAKRQMKEGGIN